MENNLNKVMGHIFTIQDNVYDLIEKEQIKDISVSKYIAFSLKESQLFVMTTDKLAGNKYLLGKYHNVNVYVDKQLLQHDTNAYYNSIKISLINGRDFNDMIMCLRSIGK